MNVRMLLGTLVCLSVVTLAVLGLRALWGPARRWVQAAVLLTDIATPGGPSADGGRTPSIDRQRVEFQLADRRRRADLYRPPGASRAGLVLLPGVARNGGDDPRLVAFARALARARFAVLVPELAGLRQLRVSERDAQEVRDAFVWLSAQPDLAPSGRAGLAAFSYAAGPALLAAMDEQVRDRVGFVFAVGGYFDLVRVLSYFTTGHYRFGELTDFPPPDSYGKWAFVEGNLGRLDDARDRRLLAALVRRLQYDPGASGADLAAALQPPGRALWNFVSNRDPRRVPGLLAALPEDIRHDIAALDLSRRALDTLHAPLILVHGYEDAVIPYPESMALARAVAEGQAYLYLVHGLHHVDVEPGLPDRWRLLRALRDLLAARDGVLGR